MQVFHAYIRMYAYVPIFPCITYVHVYVYKCIGILHRLYYAFKEASDPMVHYCS